MQPNPLVRMYRYYRDFRVRYPVSITTLICVLVYLIGLVYLSLIDFLSLPFDYLPLASCVARDMLII